MKRFKVFVLTVAIAGVMFLPACAGSSAPTTPAAPSAAPTTASNEVSAQQDDVPEVDEDLNFNTSMPIAVISREEGSGTRGAFIELLGIERDGVDHTFSEADIQNGTSAVITAVASNTYAIGYISLGSLNDTVTAISIEGVAASPETVQDGSYPIFRSFYFAIGELSDVASDFLNFVLSAEGQEIVASRGYIVVDSYAPAFESNGATGTVVVTGSTSVFPIVELLGESYREVNPNANVEVHSTGSSAGITAARDGTADLGMTSRALHSHELEEVDAISIAHDGIAIIANNSNPLESITAEEVRQIFEGELFNWSVLFN